ncbi:MAG TPA: hypothetical protein VFZ34_28675 [Blastocatellia bacterium]|nr:hypothetical protein [Blastocatellia bacterium]
MKPRPLFVALTFVVVFLASVVNAQKRDHLTEKEVDWVREVQAIDKRVEVFIKAADRRLLVLVTPDFKQTKKEEEKWGPLPTGTKAELLEDYKRILEEAEEKLDDAYDRKDALVPKALSKLKEAARKQLEQLRSLESKLTERRELKALSEAIEEAETVTKGEAK